MPQAGDLRADLPPVEGPVPGHAPRGGRPSEGTGEGEPPPEEDRGRPGPGHRHAEGAEPGKLLAPERRRRAVHRLQGRFGAMAARRFFQRAIGRTRISPVEVTTDRYRVYPRVLDELLPAAFHDTEVHANNPIETDHGRLKARLRPMRGLKRDRTARVIVAGHAFVQNLRRGFYDLGTDVPSTARLADAFSELALVI